MSDKNSFSTPKILFGGDYNPDQWLDRPDILEQDIRLMKEAGVNEATLGVFAWSAEEPQEDEFRLGWLHDIMDRLWENGISTILATPTGARPGWLDRKYPEALRVNADGSRNLHGLRHNHCPSSPEFRRQVEKIDTRLAREFGTHPGLILWHISNELGGDCFCPLCRKRFQEYLSRQFGGDIEALNRAWWTSFWSHHYDSFGEIDPPMENGEKSITGLSLAWRQFTTRNMADYLAFEADILKRETPDIPVTTNFMRRYPAYDYRAMSDPLSVISWDNYPVYGREGTPLSETFAETAFDHALMRGLGHGRPFLLMESAPGAVNWHPFNRLERPGVIRLAGLQAVAGGSDSVLYFQWRKGRGCAEQYHGAIVDHLGTDDTRIFRETAALGAELKKLSGLTGSRVGARAAVIYDWNSRWAVEQLAGLAKNNRDYSETVCSFYRGFQRLGAEADVIGPEDDFSRYDVIAAPMLYLLKSGTAERLAAFVRGGGRLLGTYLTGYTDEYTRCWLGGFPGGGLAQLFGAAAEEIDTLYPSERNMVRFPGAIASEVSDYAEILRVKDAEPQACYLKDFYAGTPAVTRRAEGKGSAWYAAARMDHRGIDRVLSLMLREAGIPLHVMPEGTEYHERVGNGRRWGFFLNPTDHPVQMPCEAGRCLLGGGAVPPEGIALAPMGAEVVAYGEAAR